MLGGAKDMDCSNTENLAKWLINRLYLGHLADLHITVAEVNRRLDEFHGVKKE